MQRRRCGDEFFRRNQTQLEMTLDFSMHPREISAQRKLDEVEKRIAALQRVRDALSELIAQCPGHGRAAACPILKALGAEIIQ